MFSPIKGKQTTFVYSPEIYEKLVSRDHLLYKINESMDFTFINEECCNLYSENMGRSVTNTPEIMFRSAIIPVSYTHLRAHETPEHLVCRLLLEKKKNKKYNSLPNHKITHKQLKNNKFKKTY